MAKWYLDRGLQVLCDQLEEEHPGIKIGKIADSKHRPPSDHLPEEDGSVDAIDPMIDGDNYTFGQAHSDVNALVASRDKRIAYIIFNGHIISSTVQPWKWRPYKGVDPHIGHWHLSANDNHENDRSRWRIYVKGNSMATQFNTDDRAILQQEAKEGVAEHFVKFNASDSLGGQLTAIGRAVFDSGIVSVDGEQRQPFWQAWERLVSTVVGLETTVAILQADNAYLKNALDMLTADPAEPDNVIVAAVRYANANP